MSQAFEELVLKNLHRIENQELIQYLRRIFKEKNLLLHMMDSLHFSLIILDEDDHIVCHNRFAGLFLEYKKQKLIGKKILEVCKIADLKLALNKLLTSDESAEYMEINVFDKTSKDFLISLSHFNQPISTLKKNQSEEKANSNNHNQLNYKVIIVSDITDWKNKNLADYQRNFIDSLHTLTAGIAHEIKNPLTAIDLHLQLIKRFISDHELGKEKKFNRWIEIVTEEIKRLESIVNDFLFSFRPSIPNKSPLNINDILIEIVEIFEPQCQEKKIKIETSFDNQMKTFLFDKDQIKQALINLIHNSIEAIEENSNVDNNGVIKLVTKEKYETIELILTDNGLGISTKKVAEIFKPFYTTKKMGTGLGLSIVTKIISDHQGEIILNTDYKKGAQFCLEFSRLPTIYKIKQISHQL